MTDAGEGIKGKVKEAAGAVSDDDKLRAEGRAQQNKADAEREASRRDAEADAARSEAAAHEAEERKHQ